MATTPLLREPLFWPLIHRCIACLVLLCCSFLCVAESTLWRISKDGHELLIGGTIHLLSDAQYPLPEEFEKAYQQASRVVFETDMVAFKSPDFMQVMLSHLLYQDEGKLAARLHPDTLVRLTQSLKSKSLSPAQWLQFKPAMVSMQLTQIELKRLGFNAPGVDQHYFERATKDGKPSLALESPEQQVAYLASMGEGMEDKFILYTLDEIDGLAEEMRVMLQAWQTGDLNVLQSRYLVPMKSQYPAVYERLIMQRNHLWVPQIESMLQEPSTELVLVGALHLVGEDGLLAALKSRGYSVTPF
ncbi:TraB/GumN family protein [Aliiglaciecola sp. CAU 1673]|uniref:TraB/GumN family protein n=1 Tax=Aliiglaciecola sp. CAU 1673 TaxID=3032595 RepID=UPI0023DA5CF1|nr:TraB/GumN family protein [Aliiglaciecola sp. CAU 1673]MDF2177114.1 TraB/GumN family protein [Aliiglaciecola sp. CAU 1673]